MKNFRIFVVMMAICMLMTGCGKHTNPSTSATPSGNPAITNDTNDTQNPTSQDVNGTTETTSQGNSGNVWSSSDPRITPVDMNNYWISDTQFDLVNYCRDQGATIKYRIYADDNHNSYTYCLPEELAASGQEPLAVIIFFYFEGDFRSVSVECSIGYGDSYTMKTETDGNILCLGSVETDEDYVWVTIDDNGTHLSLSVINHLPILFEHVIVLPYDTAPEDVTNAFNTYYGND